MISTLLPVFLLALSPQLQAVMNRMQQYPFAPEPAKNDTIHGQIILQMGDFLAETLAIRRAKGFLQILKNDSVMVEQKGDSVSLMGTMFRFTGAAEVDSSFWKNARLEKEEKEGDLDVVEGEVGGVTVRLWVDSAGRVLRQRVVMQGTVVEGVWTYDTTTGYVSEIRWQRGEGPVLKILYRWRTGR